MVKSCQNHLASAPEEHCAALLVTDGEPTECDTATTTLTDIAAASFGAKVSVPVYAMGVSGADFCLLELIAKAGGTSKAFDVSSGGAGTFPRRSRQSPESCWHVGSRCRSPATVR